VNYSICSRKKIKASRPKLKPFGITYIMDLNRKVDLMLSMTYEEALAHFTATGMEPVCGNCLPLDTEAKSALITDMTD